MRKWLIAAAASSILSSTFAVSAMASTESYVETNHGWVDYHTQAKLSSPIVGRLNLGDKAPLVAKANAWWYEIQVGGRDVYITTNTNYTHVVTGSASDSSSSTSSTASSSSSAPSTSSSTPVQTASPAPAPATEAAWQVQADKVIATAKTQIGVPYWWGHQVPGVGFDCSNFTSWVYKTALGIHFSSSSATQRYSVGTPVPLDQIREGDLLFFKTAGCATGAGHVGIYAGNGMIIQEGGGRGKVTYEAMAGTWFARDLVFARRVIQ